MSETGYVIWFIVLSVVVVAVLVALVMASMGWFTRKPHPPHQFPNEPSQEIEPPPRHPSKQYWPHTSALHDSPPSDDAESSA